MTLQPRVQLNYRLNTLKTNLSRVLSEQDHIRDLGTSDGLDLLKGKRLLQLLNLEVWAERYCMPLSWIVTKLQEWYAHTSSGALGFAVSVATGVKARERIEATVMRLYPNNENRHLNRAPAIEPIRAKSVQEYRDSVDCYKRQAAATGKQYPRPWRGNPWR